MRWFVQRVLRCHPMSIRPGGKGEADCVAAARRLLRHLLQGHAPKARRFWLSVKCIAIHFIRRMGVGLVDNLDGYVVFRELADVL